MHKLLVLKALNVRFSSPTYAFKTSDQPSVYSFINVKNKQLWRTTFLHYATFYGPARHQSENNRVFI